MYAAYGTLMLLYVMIGSTILCMTLWLMSYNIMWVFIGSWLRDLVPLDGSLSVLVTVRVYTGGPSAVVFLLGYLLLVIITATCFGS